MPLCRRIGYLSPQKKKRRRRTGKLFSKAFLYCVRRSSVACSQYANKFQPLLLDRYCILLNIHIYYMFRILIKVSTNMKWTHRITEQIISTGKLINLGYKSWTCSIEKEWSSEKQKYMFFLSYPYSKQTCELLEYTRKCPAQFVLAFNILKLNPPKVTLTLNHQHR